MIPASVYPFTITAGLFIAIHVTQLMPTPTYRKRYFPCFSCRIRERFGFQRVAWAQRVDLRPVYAND